LFGALLNTIATPDGARQRILTHAAELFHLSARSFHRVLRVARKVADPEGREKIAKPHIAEAPSYRLARACATRPQPRPQSRLTACLTLQDDV
tara:strand:- start:247 stop:525 length:279 start_codon:yes stop_codon:yes gene_type:complete